MKEPKSALSLMKSVQKLKKPQYRGFMRGLKQYLDLEDGEAIRLPLLWGRDLTAFRQKVYRTRDLFKECSEHTYFEEHSDIIDMARELNKVNARTYENYIELEKVKPFIPEDVDTDDGGLLDKLLEEIEEIQERVKEEQESLAQEFLFDEADEESIDKGLPPSAGDWISEEEEEEDDEEVEGDINILKWLK